MDKPQTPEALNEREAIAHQQATNARQWLAKCVPEHIFRFPGNATLSKELRGGVVLCELVNAVRPKSIESYTKNGSIDNVTQFVDFCSKAGVPTKYLPVPEKLFKGKNSSKLAATLLALRDIINDENESSEDFIYSGLTVNEPEARREKPKKQRKEMKKKAKKKKTKEKETSTLSPQNSPGTPRDELKAIRVSIERDRVSLTYESTPIDVQLWLVQHGFGDYVKKFKSFSGSQFLKIVKDNRRLNDIVELEDADLMIMLTKDIEEPKRRTQSPKRRHPSPKSIHQKKSAVKGELVVQEVVSRKSMDNGGIVYSSDMSFGVGLSKGNASVSDNQKNKLFKFQISKQQIKALDVLKGNTVIGSVKFKFNEHTIMLRSGSIKRLYGVLKQTNTEKSFVIECPGSSIEVIGSTKHHKPRFQFVRRVDRGPRVIATMTRDSEKELSVRVMAHEDVVGLLIASVVIVHKMSSTKKAS